MKMTSASVLSSQESTEPLSFFRSKYQYSVGFVCVCECMSVCVGGGGGGGGYFGTPRCGHVRNQMNCYDH